MALVCVLHTEGVAAQTQGGAGQRQGGLPGGKPPQLKGPAGEGRRDGHAGG